MRKRFGLVDNGKYSRMTDFPTYKNITRLRSKGTNNIKESQQNNDEFHVLRNELGKRKNTDQNIIEDTRILREKFKSQKTTVPP